MPGGEIIHGGRRAARLETEGPIARRLGLAARQLEIAEDFDAPLPDDLLAAFEGHDEAGS